MSEPEPQIRPATPADAQALARMRFRFRAELAPPAEAEAAFVARAAPWIAARLGREGWRAWVAADASGAIVGNLFMQLVEKLPNPAVEAETIAYLTNFFIVPERRRGGLGARMLRIALAACPPDQVDMVVLWPSPGSVTLYRRAGFAPPATMLELPLRGRAAPDPAGAQGQS